MAPISAGRLPCRIRHLTCAAGFGGAACRRRPAVSLTTPPSAEHLWPRRCHSARLTVSPALSTDVGRGISAAVPRSVVPGADDGDSEYRQVVSNATAGVAVDLLELSFKGRPGGAWRQVTVRPLRLKERAHLQISWYGPKQVTAKNYECGPAAAAQVDALLGLTWQSLLLRTTHRDVTIQFNKRGRPMMHSAAPAGLRPARLLTQGHDRAKDLPIPLGQAHPFLQAVGLQLADGRVKADMQDKLSQINELLKLLEHTGALALYKPQQEEGAAAASSAPASSGLGGGAAARTSGRDAAAAEDEGVSAAEDGEQRSGGEASSSSSASSAGSGSSGGGKGGQAGPLHILDCGCGSSHLTFGVYHYLNNICGIPARLSGVDTNAALMARSNDRCRELGVQAEFHTGSILEHTPAVRPDLVLALHACDTATDQALALAVKQGARVVLAVPCCHQHLHQQLRGAAPVAPFGPLLQHGILKQRMLDLLTDTFRAALLRVLGYQTECVEFVSTEHTPRNLLIRAVKRAAPLTRTQVSALLAEYAALRDYWGVKPHLEELLKNELAAATAAAHAPLVAVAAR